MKQMLRDVARWGGPLFRAWQRKTKGAGRTPMLTVPAPNSSSDVWALGDPSSASSPHLHKCTSPPCPGPRRSPRPQSAAGVGVGGPRTLKSQAKAWAVLMHLYFIFPHITFQTHTPVTCSDPGLRPLSLTQSGICTHDIHTGLNLSLQVFPDEK